MPLSGVGHDAGIDFSNLGTKGNQAMMNEIAGEGSAAMTTGEAASQLRFDGRVAIVTGAGGQQPNLGSSYAKLLASRGAKVVLNRLGVGPYGTGKLSGDGQSVLEEIRDSGGEAIIATADVSQPQSAAQAVQAAMDTWGRVDILVNNAGVLNFAEFEDFTPEEIRRTVDTHLYGHIWMAKAVWPLMRAVGYGRIVNITSSAAYGRGARIVPYAAAKGGVIGFTNMLAVEGEPHGIKVNVIAPEAATVKHADIFDVGDMAAWLASNQRQVDQVAPVVAYLCHEVCEPSGGTFFASQGVVREYMTYETEGYCNEDLTLEDVAENMATIRNRATAREHVARVKVTALR